MTLRLSDGRTMTVSEFLLALDAELARPVVESRDALRLPSTTFRPRQDGTHPRGFRPMPGPGVRR